MPRSKEVVRKRLLQAALELFAERGFEETTAAQIADLAGVTERTFFRHFPDKREVLFDGQTVLGSALSKSIAEADPGLSPIEAVREAFTRITDMIERNRAISEPRRKIIAATPALQEREIAKQAAMTQMLSAALRARGVEGLRADLTAQAGLAALRYALDAWFADPASRLPDHLGKAFDELHTLASAIRR